MLLTKLILWRRKHLSIVLCWRPKPKEKQDFFFKHISINHGKNFSNDFSQRAINSRRINLEDIIYTFITLFCPYLPGEREREKASDDVFYYEANANGTIHKIYLLCLIRSHLASALAIITGSHISVCRVCASLKSERKDIKIIM